MPDRHKSQDIPTNWVQKHTSLFEQVKDRSLQVLDLACGGGRHTRFLLEKGFSVLAVDKDISGLKGMRASQGLEVVEIDLETDAGETLKSVVQGRKFSGIVVVNYLYRPLFPVLSNLLIEGGVLIYQTFMQGNEQYGRPRNPDFLLRENELKEVFSRGFDVIDFEQGYVEQPSSAMVQKICAVKQSA